MCRSFTFIRPPKYIVGTLLLSIIALLLVACGGDTSSTQVTASPTVVPVNGFGIAANHVHSLVVLPPNVLVMATHYGLFRSQNGGTSWQVVAGTIDGRTHDLFAQIQHSQSTKTLCFNTACCHSTYRNSWTLYKCRRRTDLEAFYCFRKHYK